VEHVADGGVGGAGGHLVVERDQRGLPHALEDRAVPARAGNRRFWWLSALRAQTKAPYKMDFHRETLRAHNRPLRVGPYQRLARCVACCCAGVPFLPAGGGPGAGLRSE
jgi:hypothetical protein